MRIPVFAAALALLLSPTPLRADLDQAAWLWAEHDALTVQLQDAEDQLADLRALYEKRLVPLTRLRQLERDVARLQGRIGELALRAREPEAGELDAAQ